VVTVGRMLSFLLLEEAYIEKGDEMSKRKVKGKVKWEAFVPVNVDAATMRQTGISALLANNLYSVVIKSRVCDAFRGSDGKPLPMANLAIRRNPNDERRDVDIWADLQRVKNEILGENIEALELYPSEERRIDGEEYHLWCLPEGIKVPFGFVPPELQGKPNIKVVPERAMEASEATGVSVDSFMKPGTAEDVLGDIGDPDEKEQAAKEDLEALRKDLVNKEG